MEADIKADWKKTGTLEHVRIETRGAYRDPKGFMMALDFLPPASVGAADAFRAVGEAYSRAQGEEQKTAFCAALRAFAEGWKP